MNRNAPQDVPSRRPPAILFDLDGTLADSNYQHVIAWSEALRGEGIMAPSARIHRRIGMSGRLLVQGLFAEAGRKVNQKAIERLEKSHKKNFSKWLSHISLLPGAAELLRYLSQRSVGFAIATSGDQKTVATMIKPLRIPAGIPVITGDHVKHAKPEPDVFMEAANQLGTPLSDCIVVGDSVWDLLAARRAKALAVGLLCGGYGSTEMEQAGAYRVYKDPADLLIHLPEIGIF